MYSISPVKLLKFTENNTVQELEDLVATEEPLEIRLGFGDTNNRQQKSVSVTMRTPTHDFDLALGFLYSEGIIKSYEEVMTIKYCVDAGKQATENIVRVELKPEVKVDSQLFQRNFYMTSSCGVCGKASIEAVEAMICGDSFTQSAENWELTPFFIQQLLNQMSIAQSAFTYTGGLHAAALFDKSGKIILMREDVGRHNALDKVVGNALTQNLLLHDKIILVSSRASFELIQKVIMANIPVIATIGAPSSLAVETAKRFGVILLGFMKEDRFNVYSGADCLNLDSSD
ncbi:MAG: formate dehydrogenase accessory sulfurtransferase FdhD [Arcicella sp.]|nr:formate dehydrogenase accessory sulfurtransferase FdhD [Arcicella sp.]